MEYIEQLSPKLSREVGKALKEVKEGKCLTIDMSDRKKVKKLLGI